MDRVELERAFLSHRVRIDALVAARDWLAYGEEFTADAVYRRPGLPTVFGREAIRDESAAFMTRFPATEIATIRLTWYSVDPPSSTVVYESCATMRDPGDGSVHQASTTTSLGYAGNERWHWGMDISNPRVYLDMFRSWTRVAQRHGLALPPGAADLFDADASVR